MLTKDYKEAVLLMVDQLTDDEPWITLEGAVMYCTEDDELTISEFKELLCFVKRNIDNLPYRR